MRNFASRGSHNLNQIQSFERRMYSSTFIFLKKQFDDEFHDLDRSIAEAAKSISGYLGEETWENPSNGYVSNVYYWESLEALHELMQHPKHVLAKAAHDKWLDGYQVVISQVIKTYGDNKLNLACTQ